MKSLIALLTSPFRLIGRWLYRSLVGRYLRALSASARMSLGVLAGLVVAIFGLSAFSTPEADVDAAEAQLALLQAGARSETIAAVEAEVLADHVLEHQRFPAGHGEGTRLGVGVGLVSHQPQHVHADACGPRVVDEKVCGPTGCSGGAGNQQVIAR